MELFGTILGLHGVLGVVALGALCAIIFIGAIFIGHQVGRQALAQRLMALGARLGIDEPEGESTVENALTYLEQVTGSAAATVAETSADAIRLRRSLDALPQGIVVCDENGTVVYRNSRANSLMTSRHGDALAAQAVTEVLEDAWDQGAAERTLDLYGPPRRTLSIRAELVDDGRRPLGVIAMIDDISERRRLEDIRRDFVANVSHELKTPIGALGLLAETLITEPDVDVSQRLASRIHTEAFRVSRIIDDLLDLSRIESEEAPPREPVLINLVMADAVERVRASADQRKIEIELLEPDPPVAIKADRRQLVSAMHALLENAVTYSQEKSSIVISGTIAMAGPGDGVVAVSSTSAVATTQLITGTSGIQTAPPPPPPLNGLGFEGKGSIGIRDPFDASSQSISSIVASPEQSSALQTDTRGELREVVRLAVADKGVGIPARDLNRIFERFYRVDPGRSRATGGTGLGLSIARHVANNHHGWIEVESREGEGSTFTLVLPLMPPQSP